MDKEKTATATNEMINLYKSNKIDELIKIRDDEHGILERRLAADLAIHMPKDPRRYY